MSTADFQHMPHKDSMTQSAYGTVEPFYIDQLDNEEKKDHDANESDDKMGSVPQIATKNARKEHKLSFSESAKNFISRAQVFLTKDQMKEVDKDGDGKIDSEEIKSMIQTAIQGKREVKLYRYAFMVFITVWFLSLIAIFAVVYGAIQISKDSKVKSSDDPVLVTADGKSVIQTASSEFYVTTDGSLMARVDNNTVSVDNSGGTLKVSSTALTASAPLSSDLPDSVFREIKNIGISSGIGASMDLNVLGMLRMPATSVNHLGAVTLITHIGRIMLEGTSISYFDDNQAELFKAAGFTIATTTTTSGRRLLDDVQSVMGTFNAVPVVTSTTVENTTAAFSLPTPTIPTNFMLTALHLTSCVNNPAVDGNILSYEVDYVGGALPTTPGIDLCDLLEISDDFIVHLDGDEDNRYIGMKYTMYRMGEELLRVEYVHPLEPDFAFVQVFNRSSPDNGIDFQYQVDVSTMGLQSEQTEGATSPFKLAGPVFYYGASDNSNRNIMQEALLSKFDYLGESKLGSDAVRVWAMHLAENDVHAYWYDTVNGQNLKRINFGPFGMLQVQSFSLLETGANLDYLFQQPPREILRLPQDVQVPSKVIADAFLPFMEDYEDYVRWAALSKAVHPDATSSPSAEPTYRPTRTARPSAQPTAEPTPIPTATPTMSPTAVPTVGPTLVPSAVPTLSPTDVPSHSPSEYPTSLPSISSAPTVTSRRTMDKAAPVANLRVSRPKLVAEHQQASGEKVSGAKARPWKRPVVYRNTATSKPSRISAESTATNFFDGAWNGLSDVVEQTAGCGESNMCPRQFNFTSDAYTFAEFPGLIFTPLTNSESNVPCLFTAEAITANGDKRRLLEAKGASVFDFSIVGDLNLQMCKNLKGVSSVTGRPTIEFDYALGSNEFSTSMQKLFGFTAQSVNFLKTSDVTDMPTFDLEDGQVIFNDASLGDKLLHKLQDVATSNPAKASAIRQCLKKNLLRDEVRFDILGAPVEGVQFLSEFAAFESILRNAHFVTNIEWAWHPYFCGLSDEVRTISITFTVDLFFTQYSTTLYTNTEELVRFFETGMPVASKKLDANSLMTALNQDYAGLIDVLSSKKSYSGKVWTDIETLSSKLSDSVREFKRLNLASNTRYALVSQVLNPAPFSKTGSSVSALFDTTNPLAALYQLERASAVVDSILLEGWGCQFTNTVDPRDIAISRKIVDACASNSCDNKAYGFGTWTEAVTNNYQCYVAFDGSFNANSKSKYTSAWKTWQESATGGRNVNPQLTSTWLTKSMTTLRSNVNGEQQDFIRSFVFCASTASTTDEVVQKFAADVLSRARVFTSSEELNVVVPLAASYGIELLTRSSCFAEDFHYVPSSATPPGVSSPMEVNEVFVGSYGSQWLGNMATDAVEKVSFAVCTSNQCDANTAQKIGEYRDTMDSDKVHQCYAAIDGEFKNNDTMQTFISAFTKFALSKHGVWWEQHGWATNSFTTLRADVSWMNIFVFCADGSGDVNGVGAAVLKALRESQSPAVFEHAHSDLSVSMNQHGLVWTNAAQLGSFSEQFQLDRPLHLLKDNFVGGHGCQWIDTFTPTNPEAERWDVSANVPTVCSTATGCDRYTAQYLVSYNKADAVTSVSCYASIDGQATSSAEYEALRASLQAYSTQEGEGYWFGGDSYDGQVDGYYMNSFWSVRSPAASGSGWLNVFTWCSSSGNADGFGGAVLATLRDNYNDFEATELQLGALANKFGVSLNFDKACFAASTINAIDQPLQGMVPNGFIGGHGCQNIKDIVPFSNGASIVSTNFWASCGSATCNSPLKVTNIGSFEDANGATQTCYVTYDGQYGASLSTGIAGESLRRFMSQPGWGYWTASDASYITNTFFAVRNGGQGNEWVNVFAFCGNGGDPFSFARQVMASLRDSAHDFQATTATLPALATAASVTLYAPGDCTRSFV